MSGNGELDIAILELVIDSRAGLDVDLESHPLVWKISKTVSVRRKVAGRTGLALRIEAIRRRLGVLELEIGASEGLFKAIISPVRGRSGTGVVHLGKTARVGVLRNGFQSSTRGVTETAGGVGRGATRFIAGSDNGLFPSSTSRIDRVDEFGRETLTPLNVKLGVSTKLSRQIVGKIREVGAGAVGTGIGRDGEFQRAATGTLDGESICGMASPGKVPLLSP